MATIAGRAYCQSSCPTGFVPSSSAACLLSIYTYFIFDDAKVHIFCDMTKQSMEHSKNFPERFGSHDNFYYLCTYES